MQRAVYFNQRKKGVERTVSIAKETDEEKVQKAFIELLQKKQNQRKPVDQSFKEKTNNVKRENVNWNW